MAERGGRRPAGLVVVAGLALPGGEAPGRALLWAIVPVIAAGYLLAPAGRRALGVGQG